MSVTAMAHVFKFSPYTLAARLVHLALADYANEDHDNLCWPSTATLAAKAKVSEDTVTRALKQMVADGYLELINPYDPKKHWAATYHFVLPGAVPPPRPQIAVPPLDAPLDAVPQAANTGGAQAANALAPAFTNASSTTQGITQGQRADFFARFWQVYPRHEAKQGAKVAFDAALDRGVGAVRIIEGAQRYRDDPNRELAYTKHPSTWLHQGCWDDDPLPPRRGGRPSAADRNLAVIRDTEPFVQ